MSCKVSETKDGRIMVEDVGLGFVLDRDGAKALVAELTQALAEPGPVHCDYEYLGQEHKHHVRQCSRCGHRWGSASIWDRAPKRECDKQ